MQAATESMLIVYQKDVHVRYCLYKCIYTIMIADEYFLLGIKLCIWIIIKFYHTSLIKFWFNLGEHLGYTSGKKLSRQSLNM